MATNEKICPIMSATTERTGGLMLNPQPCLETCGFYNEMKGACSLTVIAGNLNGIVEALTKIYLKD